jgi:phosphohistidine phosphatase
MILYLVRHGPAMNGANPSAPLDPERPLTSKGMEKTREVMRGLRNLGVEPDAMITSPFLRAAQTAEIACEVLQFRREKIRKSETLLPSANPAALFRELSRIRAREVMCFGHGPQIDLALAHGLGLGEAVTELKKAGVACLEITRFAPLRTRLLWMATPRMLRKLSG